MKITIDLSDVEVRALKAYLKEVSPDINPVITKEDIKLEVQGMVSASMQAGAIGDYLQQFSN